MGSCADPSAGVEPRLVLASASPRRCAILEQLGLSFEVVPSRVPEPAFTGGCPGDYAAALAHAKAEAVAVERPDAAVMGADTIVVVEGEVLGKPSDASEAALMLTRLAGRQHQVITAVVLRHGSAVGKRCVTTDVWFRALSPRDVQAYVGTGEGSDKAGGYAVQGLGAGFVARIEGSYSNVVGLPAAETIDLLRGLGVIRDWP